jgi:hypothetical protein
VAPTNADSKTEEFSSGPGFVRETANTVMESTENHGRSGKVDGSLEEHRRRGKRPLRLGILVQQGAFQKKREINVRCFLPEYY